jgi:hypothetical protein
MGTSLAINKHSRESAVLVQSEATQATTKRTSRVGAAEVYPAIGAARFKVRSVSLIMNEIDE